jgi:hypothetical protein
MSWRNTIKIHPAADLFPLLGDDESVAMGKDIKANGLVSPVAIRIENGKPILLDGRNRLDAMERAGIEVQIQRDPGTGRWALLSGEFIGKYTWQSIGWQIGDGVHVVASDPVKYIVSANIHRRNITTETKRDLIAALLKENPERSDRATAELVKVDHKTVSAVRQKEEQLGSIPQLTKRTGKDGKARQQAASKPKASPVKQVEPKVEKPAEPEQLSKTAKEKLDAAIRQHKRMLDAEFEARVQAEVRRRIGESTLAAYMVEWDRLRVELDTRRGIMDKRTYRRILMRLHPDHGGEADLLDVWMKLEKRLVDEKESPTSNPKLPTVAEVMQGARPYPFPRGLPDALVDPRQVKQAVKEKRAAERAAKKAKPESEPSPPPETTTAEAAANRTPACDLNADFPDIPPEFDRRQRPAGKAEAA